MLLKIVASPAPIVTILYSIYLLPRQEDDMKYPLQKEKKKLGFNKILI